MTSNIQHSYNTSSNRDGISDIKLCNLESSISSTSSQLLLAEADMQLDANEKPCMGWDQPIVTKEHIKQFNDIVQAINRSADDATQQVQEAIGVALARKMEAEQQSANFIKESEKIRRLVEKSMRLKCKHPTKVGSDNSAWSPLVIKHLNETIDLK